MSSGGMNNSITAVHISANLITLTAHCCLLECVTGSVAACKGLFVRPECSTTFLQRSNFTEQDWMSGRGRNRQSDSTSSKWLCLCVSLHIVLRTYVKSHLLSVCVLLCENMHTHTHTCKESEFRCRALWELEGSFQHKHSEARTPLTH